MGNKICFTELVEKTGFEIIVPPGELDPNLSKYHRSSGVWAMFGVPKKGKHKGEYVCLNVGQTKDVGNELEIDLARLKSFHLVKKKYRNQFNVVKFSYREYAGRLDFLYRDISKKYKNITVILVAGTNEQNLEAYFAYTFRAEYWVHGKPYKKENPLTEKKISDIRNGIDISEFEEVKGKIDKLEKGYVEYLESVQRKENPRHAHAPRRRHS